MVIFRRIVAILFLVATVPYLLAPVYRFPPARRFTGASLSNPYANPSGTWQRANLHAHGRAWNGLTNGRQSDHDVVKAYHQRGYTVAGVSNYQSIAAHDGVKTLPLYEHGYNIAKQHQLAIGARRVEWLDFPLWQGPSQKQYMLHRVSRGADLVAINHPGSGYSEEDLHHLTGYQLMEVVNGPFVFEDLWDAALSSGHVVWVLANDDSHDITAVRRTAIAWNMIDAPSSETAAIVDALRAGRSYGVSLVGEMRDAALGGVELRGSTLVVSSKGAPATFLFVGQNGELRKEVDQANEAAYTITPDDSYIRTIIRTANTVMYVNPIIRHDGAGLPPPPVVATNTPVTWLQRALVALACFAVPAVLWRRPAPAAGPART